MNNILSMNLELTTVCPFDCPQCYCNFSTPKHMDFNVAKYWIDEGIAHGLKELSLSGGETMCYPDLFRVIEYASKNVSKVHASFSGFGFTQESFENLVNSGIHSICISLNGSTEEINNLTRRGYQYSISALKLLMENKFPNTILNWVMHKSNADDFANLCDLCERYQVFAINIIGRTPDDENIIDDYPTKKQFEEISAFIRNYHGPVKIGIESCFSQLRALVSETKLFGNMNVGITKGCMAGIAIFSVSVDGRLTPCRHIVHQEAFDSLDEYFSKSEVINDLCHCSEEQAIDHCKFCHYLMSCRPCMAYSVNKTGLPVFGDDWCPLN